MLQPKKKIDPEVLKRLETLDNLIKSDPKNKSAYEAQIEAIRKEYNVTEDIDDLIDEFSIVEKMKTFEEVNASLNQKIEKLRGLKKKNDPNGIISNSLNDVLTQQLNNKIKARSEYKKYEEQVAKKNIDKIVNETPTVNNKSSTKKSTKPSNAEKSDTKTQEQLDAETKAIKAAEDKKTKNVTEIEKSFVNFESELKDPGDVKEKFDYSKVKKKSNISVNAAVSALTGMMGLVQADQKVEPYKYRENEAILAYLDENRRVSKMGLPPELEAKAKKDMSDSYAVGLDNIVRNSGGNRGQVLANLAGLESAKAKGIMALNIADMQRKDAAFARYGQTLNEIEAHKEQVDKMNYNLKTSIKMQDIAEGKALANQAFSNVVDELQYQRLTGPGSAYDMQKKAFEMETFGAVSGLTKEQNADPNFVGGEAYRARKREEKMIQGAKAKEQYNLKSNFADTFKNLSKDTKSRLKNNGFDPNSVDVSKYQTAKDFYDQSFTGNYMGVPEGYVNNTFKRQIDGDTFINKDNVRSRGFGFNTVEKKDPNYIDYNLLGSFKDNIYTKDTGQNSYNREVEKWGLTPINQFVDYNEIAARTGKVDFMTHAPNTDVDMQSIFNQNNAAFYGNAWDSRKK